MNDITLNKEKHRTPKPGNSNSMYRTRTGPRCCTPNCPAVPRGVNWRKSTWKVSK